MLDIILIVISALCMIAGLAGCILPFLPGPPIAYVGSLLGFIFGTLLKFVVCGYFCYQFIIGLIR